MTRMQWRRSVFVDLTLSFGLRSTPKIFTAVADTVESITHENGADFVIHAAQVVPLGRTFLGCMFKLKAAVRHAKGRRTVQVK